MINAIQPRFGAMFQPFAIKLPKPLKEDPSPIPQYRDVEAERISPVEVDPLCSDYGLTSRILRAFRASTGKPADLLMLAGPEVVIVTDNFTPIDSLRRSIYSMPDAYSSLLEARRQRAKSFDITDETLVDEVFEMRSSKVAPVGITFDDNGRPDKMFLLQRKNAFDYSGSATPPGTKVTISRGPIFTFKKPGEEARRPGAEFDVAA